ncbi:TIGR03085 family metal-binding protein [Kytococcus schroeteri]|uniref:TIGR03085 family protein n=1 Tax=Kytococcus schroeteri TaxID=138300 RepID=A0A2I1P9Z2_9MICO|nr:TIGR03085 family metal-binding protein [Kytococcus schroeteri]PKZ41440.1 TIGR03085 family protein [Kytococcus schroeteri]
MAPTASANPSSDTRPSTAALVERERAALVATLRSLGPDAPTLCEGWTTRDMLAHMVVRERRPDVLPGIGLPGPARSHTAAVQDEFAARDWGTLLATFSRGPAPWMPFALPGVGPAINIAEYVVHHEDARRATPGWEPREDADLQQAAWAAVSRAARLTHRKAPVGVVLVAPGTGRAAVRRPPAGRNTVVVTGEPVELLLFSFGREDAARVTLEGDPADVAALRAHRRAL